MNELYHHGIKGQKWGVRRTLEQLGHYARKAKEVYTKKVTEHKEKKRQSEIKKHPVARKSIEQMTDSELQKVIDRMNLEKKYRDAYQEMHPDKLVAAKKIVGDLAGRAAKGVGMKVVDNFVENFSTGISVIKNDEYFRNLDPRTATKKDYDAAKNYYMSKDAYERALKGDYSGYKPPEEPDKKSGNNGDDEKKKNKNKK